MNFSLSETVTYQTTLTPYEVYKYLDEVIEPPKTFRVNWGFWRNGKPYEGTVDQAHFKMCKIPRGKNSTFAQAEGTFRQEGNHTIVEATISMPTAIKIFGVIWLSLLTIVGGSFATLPSEADLPLIFRFMPVFMLIVGAVIFYGGYKWNANALKNDLQKILEAEIIEKW